MNQKLFDPGIPQQTQPSEPAVTQNKGIEHLEGQPSELAFATHSAQSDIPIEATSLEHGSRTSDTTKDETPEASPSRTRNPISSQPLSPINAPPHPASSQASRGSLSISGRPNTYRTSDTWQQSPYSAASELRRSVSLPFRSGSRHTPLQSYNEYQRPETTDDTGDQLRFDSSAAYSGLQARLPVSYQTSGTLPTVHPRERSQWHPPYGSYEEEGQWPSESTGPLSQSPYHSQQYPAIYKRRSDALQYPQSVSGYQQRGLNEYQERYQWPGGSSPNPSGWDARDPNAQQPSPSLQVQQQYGMAGDASDNNPWGYGRSPLPRYNTQGARLIRTSALSQAAASWGYSAYSGQKSRSASFHGSSKQQQASLVIDGNLDEIIRNWSYPEMVARRRLVQFERYQSGSQVRLTFRTIQPEEYDSSMTVISCIFWKECEQYFVTSVDCILLLELIIDQKFSVEEKNRIRRNLEVCKPLTVSKSRQDSSPFFRLIMKFEVPRPRNIEKDVKVFAWTMLAEALKKIVGKYSVNYYAQD